MFGGSNDAASSSLRIDAISGRYFTSGNPGVYKANAVAGVALSSTGFVTGSAGGETGGNVNNALYTWEAWG